MPGTATDCTATELVLRSYCCQCDPFVISVDHTFSSWGVPQCHILWFLNSQLLLLLVVSGGCFAFFGGCLVRLGFGRGQLLVHVLEKGKNSATQDT